MAGVGVPARGGNPGGICGGVNVGRMGLGGVTGTGTGSGGAVGCGYIGAVIGPGAGLYPGGT